MIPDFYTQPAPKNQQRSSGRKNGGHPEEPRNSHVKYQSEGHGSGGWKIGPKVRVTNWDNIHNN
jgi:hypothetical protein